MAETRTAYITGASTGIGRATAIAMANAGWHVLAGVRKAADADSLRAEHPSILPVHVDVTQQSSIDAVAKVVARETGDRGLDVLFNNAGIAPGGPTEFVSLQKVREVFEVNFFGHLAVTQSVLPLVRTAHGRVIFTSSQSGRVALPYLSTYSASKHAIEGLADSMRRELKPLGVDVILIEPGNIDTPIWEKNLDPAAFDFGAEAQAVYGPGIAFAQQAGQMAAKMAVPVEKVASVVLKAATTPRPRARYTVGIDAAVATRLSRFTPGLLDAGVNIALKRDAKKR